jgi:hypothetical protein
MKRMNHWLRAAWLCMKDDAMHRRSRGVELPCLIFCVTLLVAWLPASGRAQVNSGGNGSDGAFNPATNTVINMADHPDGIYQYTSVNIPGGVTVTFVANANNSPVVWLVQSNCVINGTVGLNGHMPTGTPYPSYPAYPIGGVGGPGGWPGGSGGNSPTPGQGPGGGGVPAGSAGFGTSGWSRWDSGQAGNVYGNSSLIPLLGGSGGAGGGSWASGGGGGGGAILINASGFVELNGLIDVHGTTGFYSGGASSGGVRLVALNFTGTGSINAGNNTDGGGNGRVRVDVLQNTFSGQITGVFTQGSPIATGGVVLDIQPANRSAQSGATTTFSVVASGQEPLHYQWRFNGQNIAVGTSPTLTLTSVSAGNSGAYSVVVWNAYGSVTSATASLAVLAEGANGAQPTQQVCPAAPSPASQDGLVVVTHGFQLSLEGPIPMPAWVTTLTNCIQANAPSWSVTPLDWTSSAWGIDPELALTTGSIVGWLYGKQLAQKH